MQIHRVWRTKYAGADAFSGDTSSKYSVLWNGNALQGQCKQSMLAGCHHFSQAAQLISLHQNINWYIHLLNLMLFIQCNSIREKGIYLTKIKYTEVWHILYFKNLKKKKKSPKTEQKNLLSLWTRMKTNVKSDRILHVEDILVFRQLLLVDSEQDTAEPRCRAPASMAGRLSSSQLPGRWDRAAGQLFAAGMRGNESPGLRESFHQRWEPESWEPGTLWCCVHLSHL